MSVHGMTSQLASDKKKKGHNREMLFNENHGNVDAAINYSKASADCTLKQQHSSALINILCKTIGTEIKEEISVSLKGGKTLQFHLGKLPELTNSDFSIDKTDKGKTKVHHGFSFDEQVNTLKSKQFWNKYLVKGEVLCYDDDCGNRTYFNMNHVVDFIINNFNWRILETGRIKGDFIDPRTNECANSCKGIITYEYRSEEHKKCFVLGAHGGKKGWQFINILKQNISSYLEQY